MSDDPGANRSPYQFEARGVHSLFVDTSYQRPVAHMADRIADRFDWLKFGALLVSLREDERGAVVDGQQRLTAGHKVGVMTVPCLVVRGLDLAGEAALFVSVQRDRLNVRPAHRFRAEVVAQLPDALEIDRALRARGIELTESSGRSAPPQALAAIDAVRKVWARGGIALVEQTLDVIVGAWAQKRGRFKGDLIRGIGRFIDDEQPDMGALLDALSDPDKLGSPGALSERAVALAKGSAARGGGGSEGYIVRVLRGDYAAARRRAQRMHEGGTR